MAVVGPGALGTLVAGLLARAGERVWLVDHRPERARAIARRGVAVGGRSPATRTFRAACRATADPREAAAADLVILAVKGPQTEAALRHIGPLLGGTRWILTLQNGVGNAERVARRHPARCVFGGATDLGARLLGPGRVAWAGGGTVRIGALVPASLSAAAAIARRFARAGLRSRAGDLGEILWEKLCVSAAVNGVTGVAGVANGRVAADPDLRALARSLAAEAAAVARGLGIRLRGDPGRRAIGVARRTAANRSSLLEDLRRGRETEVESIHGAICRAGRRVSVPTPQNEAVLHLIRARTRLEE